jgi:hypothetical protein
MPTAVSWRAHCGAKTEETQGFNISQIVERVGYTQLLMERRPFDSPGAEKQPPEPRIPPDFCGMLGEIAHRVARSQRPVK